MTCPTNATAPGMAEGETSRLASTGSVPPIVAPDALANADATEFFRDSYAVIVRGRSVRRHLYFNLPAAERTVKRARARGAVAEMVLVKLVPVDARHLDMTVEAAPSRWFA